MPRFAMIGHALSGEGSMARMKLFFLSQSSGKEWPPVGR